MVTTPVVRRFVLALVFVAGSWEDILPGIDYLAAKAFNAPISSSRPAEGMPTSDADDEAGDGFLLSQAPAEQVLLLVSEIVLVATSDGGILTGTTPVAFDPVIIRIIPHVPKPQGCL